MEQIYYMGVFFFYKNPRELLKSIYDNLDRSRVEIDMIQMNGPAFENVDNRLLSLQLVKNGMTEAVIFSPDGKKPSGSRCTIQEEHIGY